MKRRNFIEKVSTVAVAANILPMFSGIVSASPKSEKLSSLFKTRTRAIISQELQNDFNELMIRIKKSRWGSYLSSTFHVNFNLAGLNLEAELERELPNISSIPGFEDFGGIRMIEPGMPQMSLLYHALASPRVQPTLDNQPFRDDEYMQLCDLDSLENYIFGLQQINIEDEDFKNNYVFAVFSYEYRSAFKTPDDCGHADFVYSRAGFSRIGQTSMNYDARNRCFSNKPQDVGKIKQIAVTPARYALFLAKRVPFSEVNILSEELHDESGFSFFKKQRSFLQPIRKIFSGDLFISGGRIAYSEFHLNEKLKKLSEHSGIQLPSPTAFDTSTGPFVKKSLTSTDSKSAEPATLVEITKCGSSVLLSSLPAALVKVATQKDKYACYYVPKLKKSIFLSNRRYTTLKLQDRPYVDALDYVITEAIYKKHKPTRFSAPRNGPLFTHIRYKVDPLNNTIEYFSPDTKNYEQKLADGQYFAAMIEDNICDGCIVAKLTLPDTINNIKRNKLENCLPAVSIVTAPDFFPYVDSFDLVEFDKKDTNFLEGGVENLSTSRLNANPNIVNPITLTQAFPYSKPEPNMEEEERALISKTIKNRLEYEVSDTMFSIISSIHPPTNDKYVAQERFKKPELRDYNSTSYLSDTASFIFAPGWDVTYSRTENSNVFLATIGLGSPFPEDMKLCAAANGMWPVASPDAARTFQGSLEKLPVYGVTPTAIPLMDDEIGIHPLHPSMIDKTLKTTDSLGWDGEQGPCFEYYNGKFWANFTDIGRADYVRNVIDEKRGFDMSKLRDLDCHELIFRMNGLRKCKKYIEGAKVKFSKLWLISAERVTDWNNGARGIGIPTNLVGRDRSWITRPRSFINGSGLLFAFIDPIYDDKPEDYTWTSSTRRRLGCKKIIVAQVCDSALEWCIIPPEGILNEMDLKWHHAKSI